MQNANELARDFFGKFSYRGVIGTITILCSFVFLFLLMFRKIPAGNETIVNVAVGFIVGIGVGGVINYYFGSSKDGSDAAKASNVSNILEAGKSSDANPVI